FFFEGGAFPKCLPTSINSCPTFIQFAGTFENAGQATNMPQGRIINVYSYQDNATWVRGRHTFKFGGEYDRQRSPNVFLPNVNGSYTFSSFNNFLRNRSTFSLTDGPPKFNFKEQDTAEYVQDDWRIKDNLTLNLGVRW